MLYKDFLKQRIGCPFCDSNEYKFIEDKHAFLSYSLAPYHKHHLLIIPKKHRRSVFEVDPQEKKSIDTYIAQGMNVLRELGYQNFTLLVREGTENAKSVEHIHWHLVPNTSIGVIDSNQSNREIMDPQQIQETIAAISEKLPRLVLPTQKSAYPV